MNSTHVVALGIIVFWLPKDKFDAIPGIAFKDVVAELRDNLKGHKGEKDFKPIAKMMAEKIVMGKG